MRRAAAALEERGLETVYIHCSGDPDSLDGVIAPAIRTAIVDGTAPHVLEPRYALAHERYVDLSQCCDSAAAKEVANGLTALTDAYRASYREAYHVLRALGGVDAERRALVRAHFDEEKLLRRAAGIAARELKGRGETRGRAADVFLGGLTCQGKVCRFDSVDALCPRVYELCDSYGLAAPVLRRLRDAALEAGEDVLFVSMSSGISGSYASGQIAARQLREEFPERKLLLVDTYSASLGEGLLVMRAVDCRREGMSIDDTYTLLRSLRHRMAQIFTVDDLRYLRRTGRLSNLEVAVGTVLQIKPLLKGDPQGKIVCFAKLRGRQRAIEAIAKRYEELVRDAQTQTVGIAHADCAPDAQILASLLRRSSCPPKQILLVDYEPVTGSHVGPGALALFFLSDDKVRMI